MFFLSEESSRVFLYVCVSDSPEDSEEEDSEKDEEQSDEEEEDEEEGSDEDSCGDEGMEVLLKEGDNSPPSAGSRPKKEISHIAATAESLQPKGYTLATTKVGPSHKNMTCINIIAWHGAGPLTGEETCFSTDVRIGSSRAGAG